MLCLTLKGFRGVCTMYPTAGTGETLQKNSISGGEAASFLGACLLLLILSFVDGIALQTE